MGYGDPDVYVRDRLCGLTRLVSASALGLSPSGFPCNIPAIAGDGSHVAFETQFPFDPADTDLLDLDVYSVDWQAMSPWKPEGAGLSGALGVPVLAGEGHWNLPNDPISYVGLGDALPGAQAFLVAGVSAANLPLKSGVLVPAPLVQVALVVGASGQIVLPIALPHGLPSGTPIYLQDWIKDPSGPKGFTASNALHVILP
jgi:hypothetical protein